MNLGLSAIFLNLKESINVLAFLIIIVLIINVILWVYVVKIKKEVIDNKNKINNILYAVRDIQDELKPEEDKD